MKKSTILSLTAICLLAISAYAVDLPTRKAATWARIVLDTLTESDEASFQQRASLQMKMFGTESADVLGQNIEVLERKLSIGAIQTKYGRSERIETAFSEATGSKIQVQRYTYGPFVLETKIGSDLVSWLYAPCGYWADGIRKTAKKAMDQSTGKKP